MAVWSFFAVAAGTEIILHIYSLHGKPNTWILDVYTPIEYGIISYILLSWNDREWVSKLIKASIPVFLAIYLIFKVSGIENLQMETVNYLSLPLSFLLLSGFAYSTLHSLYVNEHPPLRNYRFWISLSFAFYYTGSTVIFAFSYVKSHALLTQLFYSHAILNISHNILFTIGLLVAFVYKPNR